MPDIGLFGGTFDPVHHGHIQCATAALVEAGTDKVVFIPSAHPPHKNDENISSFAHRLAMLKIATTPFEQFLISELEQKRSHPSYTFDTLKIFEDRGDRSIKYHFIIGCDAFLEIESWYRWRSVISQTDFIIVVRPGYNKTRLFDLLNRNSFKVDNDHGYAWHNQEGRNSIRLLTTGTDDISSTEIKRRIRENLPWQHFVADSVGDYIVNQTLYL